jgi:hypothetical protein
MGSSVNFQVELVAKKMEKAAEGLIRESLVLKKHGLGSLGDDVLFQAEKLKFAVAELRDLMSA